MVSSSEEQPIERDAILDDLKAPLIKAQQRKKQNEQSHKREVSFATGDMMYLKL